MMAVLLFLDHAAAMGGAENSLLLLVTHLDQREWQSQIISGGGPLAEKSAALGVPVTVVPMPRLRNSPRTLINLFRTSRSIAWYARQNGITLLIANTVRAAFYTAIAAFLARRPWIWHMRDFWLSESEPRYPIIDAMLKSILCNSASHVIVNSRSVADHMPNPKHLTVVHNGIEISQFDPDMDGTAFRKEYNIPPKSLLVGMAGRLRPWKGQECFLQVAATVHTVDPAVHFIVVGGAVFGDPDNYEAWLHQMAEQLGIRERITFTGHLGDIRPALAAMDIFVHPGEPEPFGLVNIEAMVMQKPVVAFAHGALPEIVVDNKTGILISPMDKAAMASAIVDLSKDPERRKEMGIQGRKRVVHNFSIEKTRIEFSSLIANILA